jgi:hypothetical protein
MTVFAMLPRESRRNWPTFQRCLLPPASKYRLDCEAVNMFETSINFCETTERVIPEDSHLHTCRWENLKSHLRTYTFPWKIYFHLLTAVYLFCVQSGRSNMWTSARVGLKFLFASRILAIPCDMQMLTETYGLKVAEMQAYIGSTNYAHACACGKVLHV